LSPKVEPAPNFLGTSADIVSTWQPLDLRSLAGSASWRFGLSTSDNDPVFGMYTPAYFAADNLDVANDAVPEPSSWVPCPIGVATAGLISRRREPATV
jgi:hypothetical protein